MTITRHATLAALTASPSAIASVATQAAPGIEGQTTLEKTYAEWLSVRKSIEVTLASLPQQLTKHMEDRVIDPLYQRAHSLEDAIFAAPISDPRELAMKVVVAFAVPDFWEYQAVERIKADALRLVNFSDIS